MVDWSVDWLSDDISDDEISLSIYLVRLDRNRHGGDIKVLSFYSFSSFRFCNHSSIRYLISALLTILI